jgi:hypothetical protein
MEEKMQYSVGATGSGGATSLIVATDSLGKIVSLVSNWISMKTRVRSDPKDTDFGRRYLS